MLCNFSFVNRLTIDHLVNQRDAISVNDGLRRIKEMVCLLFSRIGQLFAQMESQTWDQTNVKMVAIIGCLSLSVLFLTSILVRRDPKSS